MIIMNIEMIKANSTKNIFTLPDEYNHKGIRIESILVDDKLLPKSMWTNCKDVRSIIIFSKLNEKSIVSANIINLL